MGIRRVVETESPDISVVVPTLPSHDLHSEMSLKNQRGVEYEVIVVERADLDIAEVRNLGVRSADAAYVALTDDDTNPSPEWCRTAYESVSRNGVHVVEGPVTDEEIPKRAYPGCNLAFSKEAWKAVGGFDSRYAGWMEDTVFGWDVETEFGRDATRYLSKMEMEHLGPMRSSPIESHERGARREYFDQYFAVHRNAATFKGRVFIRIVESTYPVIPTVWDFVFEKSGI